MRASKGPQDRVVESDRDSSGTYSCPPSPVRAVGVTSRASGCPVTGTDDASDVGVNVKLASTSPAMLATWLPSGAYSRTSMRSVTPLTRGMWLVTSRFWSNSRTDARPCGGGGPIETMGRRAAAGGERRDAQHAVQPSHPHRGIIKGAALEARAARLKFLCRCTVLPFCAPVAQLDRASASGAEGPAFESRLAHLSDQAPPGVGGASLFYPNGDRRTTSARRAQLRL